MALGVAATLLPGCARKPEPLWDAVEIPTDAMFTGIWFADSLNGWITGGGIDVDGGIVGRTRDGGRTWRFQSEAYPGGGDRFALHAVQFHDTLYGCGVGSFGRILLTQDGGASWRPTPAGPDGGGLVDVQFLDRWNGWAAGPVRIVRTEDGGETWTTVLRNASENGYLTSNAIHFFDSHRGWLAGHSGRLMRTEDGGRHWTQAEIPALGGEHPTFWDLTFTDESNGWAVGDRGLILRTRDGGTSWARQENGVPIVRVIPKGEPPRPREVVPELETEPDRLTVSAIHFADSLHGCAVGYYADVAESVVLRTDDGGESWRVERVQPGEILRSVFMLDPDHAWAAGDRARTRPQVVLCYPATR